MPRDISSEGHRIDWLLDVTIGFIVVLFVAMVVWMVWAAVLHGEEHKARYETGEEKKGWLLAAAIAGFVFLVVDGNLFVNSTIDLGEAIWNFDGVEKRPDTLRIEMNARQWLWQARYAGPDGKFNTGDDALATTQVPVPVETPILIQLAASDVIHNLYIPNLRVKQDAVPGAISKSWFMATETGDYEIACAQHCGVNHYKMRGLLRVVPKEEFAVWLAQASSDASRVRDDDDDDANWGWDWRTN